MDTPWPTGLISLSPAAQPALPPVRVSQRQGYSALPASCCGLFEHDKPEYLAVAFDTGKTFRDKLYPEYKATRAKMPEDLRPQINRIRQLMDAFHIPRLEVGRI